MNHLAHLLLAGPDEGLRVGALLGDHVKGSLEYHDLPADWLRGVQLHRAIDRLTDRHAAVRSLIAELTGPWRRYGPIVLDVLFDCMLTRHWARFCAQPLEQFGDEVDRLFQRKRNALPERLVQFSDWARHMGLWLRYDERDMLAKIFQGLARRHCHPSPLARGLELLDQKEQRIEQTFLLLFPDLIEASARDYSSRPSM